MKSLYTFLGGLVGFFFCLIVVNYNPILGVILLISCTILGRAIGSYINDNSKQKKKKAEKEKKNEDESEKFLHNYIHSREEQQKINLEVEKTVREALERNSKEVERLKRNVPIIKAVINSDNFTNKNTSETVKSSVQRPVKTKKFESTPSYEELMSCVKSWDNPNQSTLKHKYFYDYYPYRYYKDYADDEMWDAWHTVWNFKNDSSKGINPSDHAAALNNVINLVENTLESTFGSKAKFLTLVCLTASTQHKTDERFKYFAEKICSDLHMINAYNHITVTSDGVAKHLGGDGAATKSYHKNFFIDKYVVLFDDVRTSGNSLNRECRKLKELGAKVICAITIAQTKH